MHCPVMSVDYDCAPVHHRAPSKTFKKKKNFIRYKSSYTTSARRGGGRNSTSASCSGSKASAAACAASRASRTYKLGTAINTVPVNVNATNTQCNACVALDMLHSTCRQ